MQPPATTEVRDVGVARKATRRAVPPRTRHRIGGTRSPPSGSRRDRGSAGSRSWSSPGALQRPEVHELAVVPHVPVIGQRLIGATISVPRGYRRIAPLRTKRQASPLHCPAVVPRRGGPFHVHRAGEGLREPHGSPYDTGSDS